MADNKDKIDPPTQASPQAVEKLTAAQEDYLETLLRLQTQLAPEKVRVTDIANALGTKLPTVTRTVQKLARVGLVIHPSRGRVELSAYGETLALEITHRHKDLVDFFCKILGLDKEVAESDTCQIEHGLSPSSAQRLHEFMEYIERLTPEEREVIERFRNHAGKRNREFSNLPQNKVAGWRG